MFGMGFGEILLVVVVAIVFLGPDKLPEVMVNIAKFFKSFKKTVTEAKDAMESELNIQELKQNALSYKKELDNATNSLENGKNTILNDAANPAREVGDLFSDLKKDK